MKKLFLFLAAFLLLFFLLIRFAPLSLVRKIPLPLPVASLERLRPGILPPVIDRQPLPAPRLLKYPQPAWANDTTKHQKLIEVAEFGGPAARLAKVHPGRMQYLCAGDTFVAAVDLSTRDVVILSPELQFIRKWPMLTGLSAKMQHPVVMAVQRDRVYAIDRDGTVGIWDAQGRRQGTRQVSTFAHDLDIMSGGDLLVHETGAYPFLLAIYAPNGAKRRLFAAKPAADTMAAKFLHQGYVARSPGGVTALALINPYHLYFFTRRWIPRTALNIEPEFQVFAPFAEKKDAKNWRVLRQRVVYDIAWKREQLHVLVAPDMERAASWLEIFSAEGEFQQRFYLSLHAIRLAFWRDDLLLLGYGPKLKIVRYRFEKF